MAIKSSNKNTKEKIEPPHNGGGERTRNEIQIQSESLSRLHLARRFLNQNWTFFGSNLGNLSR